MVPDSGHNFDISLRNNNSKFDDASQVGFVSAHPAQDLDFRIKQTSQLFKTGWQQIPQDDIGPSKGAWY